MKKLLIIAAVLAVIAAGMLGYLGYIYHYNNTHVFIEDAVYPKDAESLDLRGTGISVAHYEALRAQLPGCTVIWDVPIQGRTEENTAKELTLKGLSQEDMAQLKYFSGLKTVTVTDCGDYPLLETLRGQLPQAEVNYTVALGGTEQDYRVQSLELNTADYAYDTMVENMKYLPELREVHFPRMAMDAATFAALQEAYPDVTFTYTVELLGTELDGNTASLDLSDMTSEDVAALAGALPLLSQLQEVQLPDRLTMEDVKQLKDAAPQVRFKYTFTLLGKTFTTDDTEILFKNNWKIRDDAIPQLRLALDIMNDCQKLVLDNTGVSNAAMSQFREDYRGKTEVVWRVWFGEGGSALTDVEVLRIVYGLRDSNCDSLKYLEKVRYMDIGHSDLLFNCDFVAYMPELEAAIIGGSHISSLEPFAKCPELKFLEMAYCSKTTDLEPLRNCKKLEMLNIFGTGVTDLSPIADLPLTHLCIKMTKITEEDRLLYEEAHPDCWVTYRGDVAYGEGWRTADGNNKTEWYSKINDIFGYTKAVVQNNTGWYLN